LANLLGATEITGDFWDELEAMMIQADLGIRMTTELISDLRQFAQREGITRGEELHDQLREILLNRLERSGGEELPHKPSTVAIVGVNGSGKTTTAARLARRFLSAGKSVIFAAADTYRAAANEQLKLWADRLGVDIIRGEPGSDPGAVVYNASQAAVARGMDVLLVDTSGRMHTEKNLMTELAKICKVAGKVIPDAPHRVLLVLDATTGQNGLSQAKAFTETVQVTGVVLAKLDSSARGGVGFAVASELGLPIEYVGVGEGIDDIAPFDPESYVNELLATTEPVA
jgi:fused signal recognition particle receptor